MTNLPRLRAGIFYAMFGYFIIGGLLIGWPFLISYFLPGPGQPLWLFIATESASFPYVLITLTLFALLLLAFSYRWRLVLLLIFLSFGSTQLLKTGLKQAFAEPRPFIAAMFDGDQEKIKEFYGQSREERAQLVLAHYQDSDEPAYLVQHRSREVGYSFPSGHSIFAVSQALLFVIVLGFGGFWRGLLTLAVTGWAGLVMYSRVALAMHYSQDVLWSAILAFALHLLLFFYWKNKTTVGKPLKI